MDSPFIRYQPTKRFGPCVSSNFELLDPTCQWKQNLKALNDPLYSGGRRAGKLLL
jgi:hypothetical protein